MRGLLSSLAVGVVLGFLGAPLALADVTMPAVFGSGMVLQRDMPVPIWGRADAGEPVRVSFQGQTVETVADARGQWRVALEPLDARQKGTTLEVRGKGKHRLRFKDVRVGEVWVASGQSNMAFALRRAAKARKHGRLPRPDRLRLLTIPRRKSATPQTDVAASWIGGDDKKARNTFSAVAWFFGQEIAAEVGVPVGLIHASWGGTAIAPWTPADPPGTATLYNGMVAPLVPFAIRGVIWYQGESDCGRAAVYRDAFPRLITRWRKAWGQGDFPFYFVQLANFHKRAETPGPSAWASLREAQMLTLRRVPHTGMAVAIDIGNASDIHPKNKQDVGLRLARWALAQDYDKKHVETSGPLFRSSEVGDGCIVLHFDHVAKRLERAHGRKLVGFEIAGDDGVFRWADAKIAGPTVVVSHPDIPSPVAARYAWADNPACNLQNAEGLPASPFRTDPDGTVVDGELGLRLDEAIREFEGPTFKGSVLAAKDGKIVLAKGYGLADDETGAPITPRTLFALAQTRRSIAIAAILRLQQDGKLKVTDTLGYTLSGAPPDKAALTILHLLEDRSEGDVGYTLLTAIVEVASGQPFDAYCVEHLFRRAGLEDTGFVNDAHVIESHRAALHRPPEPDTPGASTIVSTVYDLYRWDRALRGSRILDDASKILHSRDEGCFYCILSNDEGSTSAATEAIKRLLLP